MLLIKCIKKFTAEKKYNKIKYLLYTFNYFKITKLDFIAIIRFVVKSLNLLVITFIHNLS